jgi:hypothetical protein
VCSSSEDVALLTCLDTSHDNLYLGGHSPRRQQPNTSCNCDSDVTQLLLFTYPAGEFCPQGTQEETSLSIATCQLDPASYSASGSAAGGSLGACRGFKACPAGSFCPNASVAQPCVAGSYCPPGSLKGEPCNITVSYWHGEAWQQLGGSSSSSSWVLVLWKSQASAWWVCIAA